MPVREPAVAAAVNFLQQPGVATSSIESRINFMRSRNITNDEIQAALARVGISMPVTASASPAAPSSASSPVPGQQAAMPQQQLGPPHQYGPPQTSFSGGLQSAQPFFGAPGSQPFGWQQPGLPPPEPPHRDWRDWFIMATTVGGVGYGLYQLTKRYLLPLIAPPTEPVLEREKAEIDAQFEKAFALLDQLSADTATLKTTEGERTARLDAALDELEIVMADLKAANRRREDDASHLRDDVQALKEAVPRAVRGQSDALDARLKDVNNELRSLRTLVTQRVSGGSPATIPVPSSMPLNSLYSSTFSNPALPVSTPAVNGTTNTAPSASVTTADTSSNKPDNSNATTSTAIATATNIAPNGPNTPSTSSTPRPPFSVSSIYSSSPSTQARSSPLAIPAWQLANSLNAGASSPAAAAAATSAAGPVDSPAPAPAEMSEPQLAK